MIADDLKALFDSKNLSNRQVAKLSGISESSISRILRKETEDPGFQTIAHLVKTVGGSIDVMTGIASATDPVVALKASYPMMLCLQARANCSPRKIKKSRTGMRRLLRNGARFICCLGFVSACLFSLS